MTAAGQVIWINEISTITIPLSNDKIIELYNIAYTPEYNLNLISLDQLRKGEILFHDDPMTMTLIREEKVITYAKQKGICLFSNLLQLEQPLQLETWIPGEQWLLPVADSQST